MLPDGNLIRGVKGTVTEIHTPFKASVVFTYEGVEERGLLRKEKMLMEGRFLTQADEMTLDSVIKVGSKVKFNAYGNNPSNSAPWADEGHTYYIISCWCLEEEQNLNVRYQAGLVNINAKIGKLLNRQGILYYEDEDSVTHSIMFLSSKVHLYGHRLSSKQPLDKELYIDDEIHCDAVPCDSQQNDLRCSWFATVVWRGQKPTQHDHEATPVVNSPQSLLAYTRAMSGNARTVFVRGRGQVLSLLSDEFGLALLQLRPNQWNSVLFHRGSCYIRGHCLTKNQLTKVLKDGDPLRLICVSTHDKQPYKFVAVQTSIDTDADEVDPSEWPPLPAVLA